MSRVSLIRRWTGGRGMVGVGGLASRRWAFPAIRPQTVVLCSKQTTGIYTNHRIDRDGYWQQSGTQPILISAPQWSNSTCNAPTRLYRVSIKQSMKADLTIYSHAVDAPVQYMSESLILGYNLDFSSCDILVGFCKSSHISVSSRTSKFKAAMSLRSSKRTSFGRRSINPEQMRGLGSPSNYQPAIAFLKCQDIPGNMRQAIN